MNQKIKLSCIVFLVTMLSVSVFFINQLISENIILDEEIYCEEDLNISYTLSDRIHVDNNWSAAEIAGICTGNGTISNPYVIEDLVIDGEGTGSCIFIENSNDYFRIENCTVFNSDGYPDSGIRLLNVNNSKLIENNCTSNRFGIGLTYSYNNTLTGNIAMDNSHGIHLDESKNNTISGNFLNNNNDVGLGIFHCSNNTISANELNFNNNQGIKSFVCDRSTFEGNDVNDNGLRGIRLDYSNNNTLLGNTINDGIFLGHCSNNRLLGNLMSEYGLSVLGTAVELSSNNIDVTNLVNGKPLYYKSNEIFLGPGDFLNAGQVILINCNYSILFDLAISFCDEGISQHYCYNNTITGNNITNNNFGIYLRYCTGTIIYNNNISNNRHCGIHFFYGSNNEVFINIINGHELAGIYFYRSDNNNVSYNILTGNNQCFLEIECQGNVFSNNLCDAKSSTISGYNLLILLGILSMISITLGRRKKSTILKK